jgi:hypothetical protein
LRTATALALTLPIALLASISLSGCHEVSNFSTASGGVYEGTITAASFVRAGLGPSVRLCLSIDSEHLQESPGTVTTDDGLFNKTALRSIPQLWQDPLSTFNFGDGRIQNVLYVATGSSGDAGQGDVYVVISFMISGAVEVRLFRGAPGGGGAGAGSVDGGGGGGDASSHAAGPPDIFAVFSLLRQSGSCPF